MTSSFTVANSGGGLPDHYGLIILVTYMIALMVSLIFSNLIYVNAGLMYYDSRTELQTFYCSYWTAKITFPYLAKSPFYFALEHFLVKMNKNE